jgi:hypothetical protein
LSNCRHFLDRLSHVDAETGKAVAIRVKVSASQGLLFTSALSLIPQIECSGPIQGGILAKQPADSDSLETTLLRAREIAEELGEAVALYFIDMAILEARRTNPPTAINNKPRVHKESGVSPKKTKQIRHSGSEALSSV